MAIFLPKTIFNSILTSRRRAKLALAVYLLLTATGVYAQNPADACASAVALTPTLNLTATAYTLPGTYVYDGLSPICNTGFDLDDGWYTFTAQTTNYTFTLGGDYNHTAAIYTGACGSLTSVACDNATTGTNAIISFTAVPTAVYYIQVQRNGGLTTSTMSGTFSLYYSSAPGGVKNTMKAWYRADGNIVKTGSNVTRWNTEYGTVNFTNVFNIPTLSVTSANFNPSVVFPGNAYLNNPVTLGSDIIHTSNNTVFLVTKVNSGGVLLKWDQDQNTNRFDFETWPFAGSTMLRFDHPSHFQMKRGGDMFQWNIATAATTAATDNFLVNGLTVASGPGGSNNTTLNANFTIGGDSFSGFHSNSEITETVFYGTTLSALEHSKVQSYLAVKYGVTLGTNANPVNYQASNGTITWPINSTDQNDIAGIGRDDASGLSQLKSTSASSDDIVTMALVDNGGSFAAPNVFDNDLEFELWGNDNGGQPSNVLSGGLIESTFECPTSILKRLARQWHVVETGAIGDVALTFDLNGIPVTGTSFYDFRLLIDLDKDGDFTSGTVKRITPSSYAGGIVTFNNVDFNNDEIFTLATLVPAPGGVSSGLQIWLRASELTSTTTNNAQLNTWYNAGSSNFDFNRITGSNAGWPRFKSNVVNFNHAIQFGASGAMISQNSAVNMRPTTNNSSSMVVFKTTQTAGNSDFWESPNFVTTESYYTGRDYGFGLRAGRIGLKIKNGEPWDIYSNNVYNDNIFHIASAHRTRSGIATNPSTVSIQVDGIADMTATSAGDSYALDASDAMGVSFKGTGIGGNTVTGTNIYTDMQYVGLMPEIIVFNNVLTGVNLNKVNSYLAIKYGLTLGNNTSSVSYINSSAAVVWNASSTHQHDIVAIGRDDRSQLDQRRSISVEIDNMIDVALVDNGGTQATPDAFNADLEFFITGNNDGAVAFNTADVDGTVILNRLSRVFKVQETGTVGNVFLAVNLTNVPTAITGSELRLVVDRDNDGFADNDVAPQAASSYDAITKIVTFVTDLNNGDLFTVGTAVNPLPVEFLGIKAIPESDKNKITWQTASELNNRHFVIERLVHGQEWDSIGIQPAMANANGIHSYEFADVFIANLPFAYYRIVQYDYDGKFAASKIVYVDRSILNNNTLVKISPNPSDGNIDVNINGDLFATNKYRLAVYSILGIKVFDSQVEEASSRLDLTALPSGNYIIEILNSTGTPPIYENIIIKRQ